MTYKLAKFLVFSTVSTFVYLLTFKKE